MKNPFLPLTEKNLVIQVFYAKVSATTVPRVSGSNAMKHFQAFLLLCMPDFCSVEQMDTVEGGTNNNFIDCPFELQIPGLDTLQA